MQLNDLLYSIQNGKPAVLIFKEKPHSFKKSKSKKQIVLYSIFRSKPQTFRRNSEMSMTKLCESIKVFRDASMEYECIPAESMRLIPDVIKRRLLLLSLQLILLI